MNEYAPVLDGLSHYRKAEELLAVVAGITNDVDLLMGVCALAEAHAALAQAWPAVAQAAAAEYETRRREESRTK